MKRALVTLIIVIIPIVVGFAFYEQMTALKLDKQVAAASKQSFDAKTYVQQTCTSCHGADLRGAYGPNLHQAAATLTEAQIEDILKNGKTDNGKSMPPGQVKDPSHIPDVAKYIKSLANS